MDVRIGTKEQTAHLQIVQFSSLKLPAEWKNTMRFKTWYHLCRLKIHTWKTVPILQKHIEPAIYSDRAHIPIFVKHREQHALRNSAQWIFAFWHHPSLPCRAVILPSWEYCPWCLAFLKIKPICVSLGRSQGEGYTCFFPIIPQCSRRILI